MAEISAGHPVLLRRIRDEIRAAGSISFARFMNLALHDPEAGYYARGPERLGRGGDYFTASDVGSAFGTTLAASLAQMDEALGRPDPFRYVEHAAGRGWLARDVLDALSASHPGLRARLDVELVDASPGMRAAAAALVPEARVVPPGGAGTEGAGCVVAVEMLDALPVHRVRRRGGALVEVSVGLAEDALVEIETPPALEVRAWAERYGAAPAEGDEAEVALALNDVVCELAGRLRRGFVAVVDYGHEASRLFSPAHRRGTLLAYHAHAAGEDYLDRVGEQDLTAHVNLTALRDAAERAGLAPLAVTTQERFLLAHGILDTVGDGDDRSLEATKRRLQVGQLLHPHGMGRAFKVAIFSKGVDPLPDLPGLRDPFA